MHDLNTWLADEISRRYPNGIPTVTFSPLPPPNLITSDELSVRVLHRLPRGFGRLLVLRAVHLEPGP